MPGRVVVREGEWLITYQPERVISRQEGEQRPYRQWCAWKGQVQRWYGSRSAAVRFVRSVADREGQK